MHPVKSSIDNCVKSVSLHYEDVSELLYSCGSTVGNIRHGRNQVNPMIKAFQAYLLEKLNRLMINGKKEAIPIEAPAVYDFKDSEVIRGNCRSPCRTDCIFHG